MINNELLKKLKEAEFMKYEPDKRPGVKSVYMYPADWVPTLSELIEACGSNFKGLVQATTIQGQRNWVASAFATAEWFEYGDTPEEAVANLWLKLKL